MSFEMMNREELSRYVKTLTQEVLISQAKYLVEKEREITAKTLVYFSELDRRMIPLRDGFGSLHGMLVQVFGFTDASANRRVAGARLLASFPEIEEKIIDGSLTLTNVAAAQNFFNTEAKHEKPLGQEEKREVLESLVGKSTREAVKELFERSSVPTELKIPDKIKQKSASHVEIRFLAPQELAELLDEAKGLLSHRLGSGATLADVIQMLAEMGIEKIKKDRFGVGKKQRKSGKTETEIRTKPGVDSKSEVDTKSGVDAKSQLKMDPTGHLQSGAEAGSDCGTRSDRLGRYISVAVKRAVYLRAQGRCEYADPKTGRRCGSRRFLEYDHAGVPFSHGGDHSIENLMLVCNGHNYLRAVQVFGEGWMMQYRT